VTSVLKRLPIWLSSALVVFVVLWVALLFLLALRSGNYTVQFWPPALVSVGSTSGTPKPALRWVTSSPNGCRATCGNQKLQPVTSGSDLFVCAAQTDAEDILVASGSNGPYSNEKYSVCRVFSYSKQSAKSAFWCLCADQGLQDNNP
jgi:hypothetical protein